MSQYNNQRGIIMSTQFQRLQYIFLSFFIVFAHSQAQSPDSASLHEGMWALQFGITGLFTLTSLQGSTFSAKYHFSDRSAIRGGITINGNTSNGTSTSTAAYNDTSTGTFPGSTTSSNQGLSFIVQYLYYA